MKKTMRKLLITGAAALIMFSSAACGSSNESERTTKKSTESIAYTTMEPVETTTAPVVTTAAEITTVKTVATTKVFKTEKKENYTTVKKTTAKATAKQTTKAASKIDPEYICKVVNDYIKNDLQCIVNPNASGYTLSYPVDCWETNEKAIASLKNHFEWEKQWIIDSWGTKFTPELYCRFENNRFYINYC